jgi:G3E family GTPase
MIPIILITGFLGSGKTTLVREIFKKYKNRKIIYLINEFSDMDVDGKILRDEGQDIITVTGGSIFCKCLVTTFISNLQAIVDMNQKTGGSIEGLVIEASGIANPATVSQMLTETKLDKLFVISMIINIVEPQSFVKLIQTLPVITAQVRAADKILVNKTDVSGTAQVKAAISGIKKIAPLVNIVKTNYCHFDFDLFTGHSARNVSTGAAAHDVQPEFGRYSIRSSGILDIEALKRIITKNRSDFFRIKGFARTSGDRVVHIDYSDSGWQVDDSTAPESICHLEFIYNTKRYNEIKPILQQIRRKAFS